MKLTTSELNQVIAWRRHFHAHPELSTKEFQTSAKIKELLDSFGIPWRTVHETGIIADVMGEKSDDSARGILLRADIDALPIREENQSDFQSQVEGVSHACGHDGHTAMLLGVAQWLASHRDQFSGIVRLAFQHAEEVVGGARDFLTVGALEGMQRTGAVHLWPALEVGKIACPAGPIMAGCELLQINIYGSSAHMSTPQLARNPLIPAAEILLHIQAILSQRFSPFEPVLVGVGMIQGGSQNNVIPAQVRMEGSLRFFDESIRQRAHDALQKEIGLIAQANGCTAEVSFSNYTPATVNDETAAADAQRVAAEIVGEENVMAQMPLQFAGDDFSFFLRSVSGVYAQIGVRNPDRPEMHHPLHHACFNIDERALGVGAEYLTNYALDFLNPKGSIFG